MNKLQAQHLNISSTTSCLTGLGYMGLAKPLSECFISRGKTERPEEENSCGPIPLFYHILPGLCVSYPNTFSIKYVWFFTSVVFPIHFLGTDLGLSLSFFLNPALISPLNSLAPRPFLATGPARFVIAALLASSAAHLPQDPSWACCKHGLTLLVLNFMVKPLTLVLSVLRNIF